MKLAYETYSTDALLLLLNSLRSTEF